MRTIRIRRSYFIAYVDDEDYALVMQHKWYLYPYREPTYYACTGGTGPTIYMHRLIHPSPPGLMTCHKNGNGLDNRRENLTHLTNMENLQNKRMYHNNTSGVSGVKQRFYHHKPRWEAQMSVMGERIYLGVFGTFEEAVEARKEAELKYRGRGG